MRQVCVRLYVRRIWEFGWGGKFQGPVPGDINTEPLSAGANSWRSQLVLPAESNFYLAKAKRELVESLIAMDHDTLSQKATQRQFELLELLASLPQHSGRSGKSLRSQPPPRA